MSADMVDDYEYAEGWLFEMAEAHGISVKGYCRPTCGHLSGEYCLGRDDEYACACPCGHPASIEVTA